MTLVEILESNTKKFPEKTAVIFQDIKISYKELNETVNKIANSLSGLGVKKGDRVALMLPRVPELVISFLAAAKSHAIAAPVNFELQDIKLRTVLTNITPTCLIVHKQFLELAKRSIPSGMKVTMIVVGGRCAGDGVSWDEMLKNSRSDGLSYDIHEQDVVYLNYTSGSTGNPKGAITTHSNIYWNTFASVNSLRLTEEDVHLCMFAPFAHPHELFARPLYLGGTMVLLDKIYPKSIAEAISNHGITCMMGLAPMYDTLLELLEHKAYDLSSLRIPESGGMHTRIELIEKFKKKIGVSILPVWGSTETTGIALANVPGEPIMLGSVGKPCISYEARIVDEYGSELPVGQIGEMIFKGPAVIQSYYENSVNNLCFRDGWYYSGDLGRKDEENNFYFVDRKTGMMKVAGLKVYPMEIELMLNEHPDVKEAAVIPAKDNLRGEVPKAIIVIRNGKNITEKDIINFCRERMPNYKVPRIIEFRETLPKIGSGKINKKELQLEEILNH